MEEDAENVWLEGGEKWRRHDLWVKSSCENFSFWRLRKPIALRVVHTIDINILIMFLDRRNSENSWTGWQ